MKYNRDNFFKRALAVSLCSLMLISTAGTALAAELHAPTCDESYYATLDYYGGLQESSVVKTYRTYGNQSVKDYGVYDKVTNLTDERKASTSNGEVVFDLSGNVPDKLCFEGQSKLPFEQFPWKLNMSYTLNGVPVQAEELAGEKGVVEIFLDAVPNESASEYTKNNLVLTAVSVFNGDDILSLEAPGAQVQLIGNLYCVLFAVLPGEEQHFSLRVGSDDFTYSGMVFLAVPATLRQLEKVADIKEAADKLEDSYNAINDSMDVILNTLDGMSGSMSTVAGGLESLDTAREIIAQGSDEIYGSLDSALESADVLCGSIAPLSGHLAQAGTALEETVELLNRMSENITGLSPEVENARKILGNIKSDLGELEDALDTLSDKDLAYKAKKAFTALSSDLDELGNSVDALGSAAQSAGKDLAAIEAQLKNVENSDNKYVTVDGKTVAEIEALVAKAEALHQGYEASGLTEMVTFEQFIAAYLQQSGADAQTAAAQAAALSGLWMKAQTNEFAQQIAQAKELNKILAKLDISVNDLKKLVGGAGDAAGPAIKEIKSLCDALGSGGISSDLSRICDLTSSGLAIIDENKGSVSAASADLKEACSLAERLSSNVDTALGQIGELTGIMNKYEPEMLQTLKDAETFAKAASDGINAVTHAAGTAETLMKKSDGKLNQGTHQTLSGLADLLRQSSKGLGQTGTIRAAKDTVSQLIDDQWEEHTGGSDNFLLVDGTAPAQSMTDERNENVTSVQYVMRSREITKEDREEAHEEEEPHHVKTTLWQRIVNMFKDMWNSITGIFKKNK